MKEKSPKNEGKKMKKLSIICLAALLAVVFCISTANAEASAKATAVSGALKAIDNTDGWTTVMENNIKTANTKDLFISVSMECGLTTNTMVASRFLLKALAEAEAAVKVRVLIDSDDGVNGNVAVVPGDNGVTFAKRNQMLIAEFAGALAYYDDGSLVVCMEANPDTGEITVDENCVAQETLQLILETMSANAFNFVAKDVPVGPHKIEVQAMIEYHTDTDDEEVDAELSSSAVANAYIGNGSVTVEEVRMIKDEDIAPEL